MENPLTAGDEYDSRYLAGVLFFNRGDYFEAHEIWEDLWHECDAAERRFYQGLIQEAVALYHAIRGNRVGASRLLGSGGRYLALYPPRHRGLEREPFLSQVRAAIEAALGGHAMEPRPRIELDPSPHTWPDPESVLRAGEEQADS